jgi:radical SAM protein with 4Fe4S-binding SPASM domain
MIVDSPKVYRKENSFVEIRQDDPDRTAVHRRVRALQMRLMEDRLSDYRSQIVKKACDAILSPTGNGSSWALHDYVIQEMVRLKDEELARYLFYRYRYETFPRRMQLDDYPPCLQIEPASICNYRCVFCYQTDKQLTDPKNGHMGLMSVDLFKKIIDEAEGRCEAITLASRGEPLINRQIDEMLAYARGKFLAVKINTNAWYLDERKAHSILQADINTLVFSADAAVEPLYSQLRVNGKLERVLANIRQFREIRARHYPESRTITRVSGVRFCDGQNIDDMEGLWGELVDQVAFVDYNPWENTYERPLSEITTPCSDLWRRTFVWFDGKVNPCDVDYRSTLAVGNVNQENLSSLWTGENYSALRASHLEKRRGAVSPCNRCTLV